MTNKIKSSNLDTNLDINAGSLTTSGNLTVDVSGNIRLDADDAGEIRLLDGGTQYGALKNDSSRLKIQGMISDQDILIVGNDGGVETTAVAIDMSEGGRSRFYGGISLGGDGAANTLDDFEEGTWTGTISDGTNNATMGSNTGSYIKIGSLVFVAGYFTVTNLGSVSGNLRLIGLPFACGSSNSFYTANGAGWSANMSITDDTSIGFQIDTNASHLNITNYDNTSGTTTLQASEITGIGQFMLNLTYRTDA